MTAKHNALAHRVTALSQTLQQLLLTGDRQIAAGISVACRTAALDIFPGNRNQEKKNKAGLKSHSDEIKCEEQTFECHRSSKLLR